MGFPVLSFASRGAVGDRSVAVVRGQYGKRCRPTGSLIPHAGANRPADDRDGRGGLRGFGGGAGERHGGSPGAWPNDTPASSPRDTPRPREHPASARAAAAGSPSEGSTRLPSSSAKYKSQVEKVEIIGPVAFRVRAPAPQSAAPFGSPPFRSLFARRSGVLREGGSR